VVSELFFRVPGLATKQNGEESSSTVPHSRVVVCLVYFSGTKPPEQGVWYPAPKNNSRPEAGSSGKWGMLHILRSFNRQATALSNASFPLQMLSSVLGRNYPFPVIPLATPTRYLEK
jgi:hypothetical protein